MEEISIGDALWVAALAAVTLGVFVLWNHLERRKQERAESEGADAVKRYREAAEQGRARSEMKLRLDAHIDDKGEWRILVWDAEPYFEDQVEGVLVPFHIAKGATQEEAEEDFDDWLVGWLADGAFRHGAMKITVETDGQP